MSQMGQYLPLYVLSTLTGNAGGAVAPTAGNIDILGAGFLTVTGTPATSTLTISDDGTVATSYVTDAGTATPAAHVLNVLGGTNINTAGAGANLTVNLDDNITVNGMNTDDAAAGLRITGNAVGGVGTDANVDIRLIPQGVGSVVIDSISLSGTTIASTSDLTLNPTGDVIVSSASPDTAVYFDANKKLKSLDVLGDGELMIGDLLGPPKAAHLTSVDNTVAFTRGPGSLDLVVGDSVATTFTADVGNATPAANNINILGGAGIATSGAGSTITITRTGAGIYTYTAVSASPYVVLATDNVLSVDCSGIPITIQLPDVPVLGQVFRIKDRTGSANANNITVTTVTGATNIDGAATFVMNVAYESITVIGNSSTYEVL